MENTTEKYFYIKNKHLRDGSFKIIGEYVNRNIKILCEDKFGKLLIDPKSILGGCNSSIRAAINPTEYFINQAKAVHGDKYDYSLVEYVNSKTKIKIICNEHGIFEQVPESHLVGRGCPACGRISVGRARSVGKENFLLRANKVHNNFYLYTDIPEYVIRNDKIGIICPIHGEFTQDVGGHLSGKGCKKCGLEKAHKKFTHTKDKFISNAIAVHGNKYSYDNLEYVNSKTKVTITCPIHGDFEQKPNNHLTGFGCEKCGKERTENTLSIGKETFLDKAFEIHGDKYTYYSIGDNVTYQSIVSIGCEHHGIFTQRVSDHLSGCGCQKCGNLKIKLSRQNQPSTWTLSGWHKKAMESKNFDSYKFYLLKFYNEDTGESFVKSGITFLPVAKRYYAASTKGGYKYEVLKVVERFDKESFEDCEYIFKLERKFQNMYKKYKHKPESSFNGENECFVISRDAIALAGIKKMNK